MDLDRIDYHATHDNATGRLLVMEFKGPHEPTNKGQWLTLKGMVGISPQIEAWALRRRIDDRIGFFDIRRSTAIEIIGSQELQRRYSAWWNASAPVIQRQTPPNIPPSCKHKPEFKENGRCWVCHAMRRSA